MLALLNLQHCHFYFTATLAEKTDCGIPDTLNRKLYKRRGVDLVPTPFLLSNYQIQDKYYTREITL